MKKYIISEKVFNKVKHLIEQEETSEDNIITLTPEKYKEYLKFVSGKGDLLSNIKIFKGKEIYITDSLDLRDTNVTSLGPVKKINGRLDISNTKISKLPEGLKVNYVWDHGTPIEARRKAAELRQRKNEAEESRENGEWDLDSGDEIGEMAHALLQYLENDGFLEVRTEEDSSRLEQLYLELNELQKREDDANERGDDVTDIVAEIEVTEDEINEIEKKKDVYDLYVKGSHYELTTFSLIEDDNGEWAVGTESQADESLYESIEQLIDDIGYTGFNRWLWESNIDKDKLYDYFYDDYYDMVYDDPKSYGVEYTLSSSQEKRIQELQTEIEGLQESMNELDEDDENYQELYDEYEEKISELEDEINDIESDPDDIDESSVESVADDMAQERVDDIQGTITHYGVNIEEFIDKDEFIKDIIREDGYGQLSSYDNSYDTVTINNTEYYIFRIN